MSETSVCEYYEMEHITFIPSFKVESNVNLLIAVLMNQLIRQRLQIICFVCQQSTTI